MENLQILSIVMLGKVLFFSIDSTVTMVSFIYAVSTAAFYTPAEEVSQSILALFLNTSYFPLGNMNTMCRVIYTFFIPVGSIAWFPTKVLVEQNRISGFIFLIIPVAALSIANLFFRKGLNYYAKEGTGRYSGFGHR